MESALGVGRLTSLELLNPDTGKTSVRRVSGKWLAWRPKSKAFVICRVLKRAKNPGACLSPHIEKAHRKFHLAPSSGSPKVIDAPEPCGELKQVALLKALTYLVPNEVRSPSKNNSHWHHAFGDTGHKGGVYTPKVMPALCVDRNGNIFIRRRKGNIFTVDSWLRG